MSAQRKLILRRLSRYTGITALRLGLRYRYAPMRDLLLMLRSYMEVLA